MKKITLPTETVLITTEKGDKIITSALDLLEDVVMVRGAWRSGDGPKNAETIFAAIDKVRESGAASWTLRLPDKAYNALVDMIPLEPGVTIPQRSTNRLYLRLARAVNEAEEVDELSRHAPRELEPQGS